MAYLVMSEDGDLYTLSESQYNEIKKSTDFEMTIINPEAGIIELVSQELYQKNRTWKTRKLDKFS